MFLGWSREKLLRGYIAKSSGKFNLSPNRSYQYRTFVGTWAKPCHLHQKTFEPQNPDSAPSCALLEYLSRETQVYNSFRVLQEDFTPVVRKPGRIMIGTASTAQQPKPTQGTTVGGHKTTLGQRKVRDSQSLIFLPYNATSPLHKANCALIRTIKRFLQLPFILREV